jgi:GalNAc-alpha-(1->4)-GalNAc-alpha-(1->3)-diNAcBac-PP-undecaprenol alpha-1,4-N-acetyl-D-galactosaminyltransferase
MKILFLIPSLYGGGAERVASILCNHWAETSGIKVSLLTFDSSKNDSYRLSNKVKRHCIGYHGRGKKKLIEKLSSNAMRLFLIKRVLRSLKPDVVVAFMPEMNILALLSSLFTGIPVVISERTYPPYFNDGNFFDIARKAIYRLSDAFVSQTSCTAIWAQSFLKRTRITVIPNPIKLNKPSNIKKSDYKRQKIILATGRLDPQKGFDMLIDAYHGFYKNYTDWKLMIIGEGAEREKLEKQIKRLKLNKAIILLGRVNNPDYYYKLSSIFVLSSRVEGFPNALVEAMSCGVPSISFNCKSGPSDIIKDNQNGLLVPANNIKALSEAMKKLASNVALRRRLSDEAIKLCKNYSAAKVSNEWIKLFNKVIGAS